ncbi:hypothetical protein [Streptomyces sp. NBC_00316]|nr:hypothetical protein [Streptomyces sp. NBC_00316]
MGVTYFLGDAFQREGEACRLDGHVDAGAGFENGVLVERHARVAW